MNFLKRINPTAATIAVILAAVAVLHSFGRLWWCACGDLSLWAGDTYSIHMSQHLVDPYSFTHVLHGVILFWVFAFLLPRISTAWNFVLTVAAESIWEVIENTDYIINRYREVTVSIGYIGDSIFNSLSDIAACALGFEIARRVGLKWSIVVFVVVEVALLFVMRDNLTLNVVMLFCPLDSIKAWQAGS